MTVDERKKVWIYIIAAYLFSVVVHMLWAYIFHGYTPFMWNGQFMINTNDGYYWAEGARDVIAGFHQPHDLSPVDTAPAIVTAYLYKILPFSFESIIFYVSAFFSSLVVIPIILIAKNLKLLDIGFVAALLAGIAWSYYNRTLVGYYDTDMLNIVFPAFLLWSLMLALRTKKQQYLIYTALEIIAYRTWYPQSYSLEFAFFALILGYTLYLCFKKEETGYHLTLLSFMLLAMMAVNGWIRLAVVGLLYAALVKDMLKPAYIKYLFALSIAAFFVSGGFTPIWHQLKNYVFRDTLAASKDVLDLHFFTVMQTVREAGHIPFETFANRISGHTVTFILSLAGYVWMSVRYPIMLLGLPLVGLGFLAEFGGLRFTIYAVPVLAFGIAYLIFEIAKFFHIKALRYIFIVASTLLVLAPNLWHAYTYRVPTVFIDKEVKVLDDLRHKADREDYVISWWDYGYPIRYYSDVKTLIDGGKHSGAVNFPVSFELTNDEARAAKLARLDVEYTEKKAALVDEKKIDEDSAEYNRSTIAQMTLDYGFKDVNAFLDALAEDDFKLPKKSRDIYFFLPDRMMGIFPTVAQFSNIDLMSGATVRNPIFLVTTPIKQMGPNIAVLYQNRFRFLIDTQKGEVDIGKKKMPISQFIVTYYDKSMKLHVQKQTVNLAAKVSVIYMKNYNRFLILDADMLDSTYVKLFVLEEYDPRYFEPVELTPLAKIYRLKI